MVITKSLLKFGLLLIIFHENCAGNRYNISYAGKISKKNYPRKLKTRQFFCTESNFEVFPYL